MPRKAKRTDDDWGEQRCSKCRRPLTEWERMEDSTDLCTTCFAMSVGGIDEDADWYDGDDD